MSVVGRWDDDAFIRLIADLIPEDPDEKDDPVNLAVERQNQMISMAELAGDSTWIWIS